MFIVPAEARSWVPVDPTSPFSLQNLPFGLLAPRGLDVSVATAIGPYVVDITALRDAGYLVRAHYPALDAFEEFGSPDFTEIRKILYELLLEGSELEKDLPTRARAFIPLEQARLLLPIRPGQFTDFYSGIHHATNVGRMFRPDSEPLSANYRHLPVAYNGRANSVVVSGTPIIRPSGQSLPTGASEPVFRATKELDFELELGFYVGMPSAMGEPVRIHHTEEHILGFVLVNDWSARDLQRWESHPLGPFLAKSFATSVSPWLVLPDALEPFRLPAIEQDPEPQLHLLPRKAVRYDLKLEAALKTTRMSEPQTISRSNAKYLYWSFDQQLAHLTSNGTPLAYGELIASGTISGPLDGSYGSLLELSWRGEQPLTLDETGETRTYLHDGDTVILSGYAQGNGFRVGFGDLVGTIVSE